MTWWWEGGLTRIQADGRQKHCGMQILMTKQTAKQLVLFLWCTKIRSDEICQKAYV